MWTFTFRRHASNGSHVALSERVLEIEVLFNFIYLSIKIINYVHECFTVYCGDICWLFSDKAETGDKEADGLVFCNNNDNDSGNNFINSNLQDDEFSATFNVPDMDISAGALNCYYGYRSRSASFRTQNFQGRLCAGRRLFLDFWPNLDS